MWRVVAAAAGLSACVTADLTICSDGRACPGGTVCDDVHASCVTPPQATACEGLTNGDRCDAAGRAGICDRSFCISGCGDGVHDAGEGCDDGDHGSHDGCSSTCLIETPSWREWKSPWLGRAMHVAAYDEARGTLEVFGGLEHGNGVTATHWSRRHATGGLIWTAVTSARPAARYEPAAAYHRAGGVLVLFGGGSTYFHRDTWEYDGTSWQLKVTAVSPPTGFGSAMVYDSYRQKLVLVGGFNVPLADQVWEYDVATTTWTRVTTTGLLTPFAFAPVAYDPTRQLIVALVGNETWEYAPATATWTRRMWPTSPSPRRSTSMVFFPPLNAIVLFGGYSNLGFGSLSDTWEYSATGWSQRATANAPPGRFQSTLTLDSSQYKLVLVGGIGSVNDPVPLDDVWEFNSSGWVEANPRFSPSPRFAPLAYDEARREIVVLEGYASPSRGETWIFDGGTWTSHVSPTGSIQHRFHCSAYDASRQRVIVFGGRDPADANPTSTTLEWDGALRVWTTLAGAAPPARSECALAYDSDRRVSVLFGGGPSSQPLTDTWELDGPQWTQVPTASHPSAVFGAMAYDRTHARMIALDDDGSTWQYVNREWSVLPLEPAMSPPARYNATLAFDPRRETVVLYGGDTFDPEVWELSDAGWRRTVTEDVRPSPRLLPGLAPLGNELVMFGGLSTASGSTLGDTWTWQYRSESPGEVCGNQLDDDLDLRVDLDDPDCR